MSVNDAILQQLQEMGIDWPLARAAAQRYNSVDAAVNWCFGPGADWRPEDDKPKDVTPRYDFDPPSSGATVTHHEVYDSANSSTSNLIDIDDTKDVPKIQPKSPPLPPRPQHNNLSAPFASNNPFRNHPPPPIEIEDNDEDEDLRKALAMSREGMEGGDEDRRAERERSVRASGVPPPSPEGEDVMGKSVVFGPSEKDDQEGKLAMVPSTQPANQASTEDQDMEKAIADSLMTASFHSASALQAVERPTPRERDAETPLVFWSESGNSTYAALLLQAMIAIPQFREAISSFKVDSLPSYEYMRITYLQELVERYQSPGNDFVDIDGSLKELRNGHEPTQLPPHQVTLDFALQLQTLTSHFLTQSKEVGSEMTPGATFDYSQEPDQIFRSEIDSDPRQSSPYVDFWRFGPSSELNLYSMLAMILWDKQSNASIEFLSDVLTVRLGWGHGSTRELWSIDERVVLDRYLKENMHRSINIRAQQHAAAGNARRTKEKIQSLTQHKGDSTLESLAALIKFYETSPNTEDAIKTQSRDEIKAKDILAKLEGKKAALDEIVQKEEEAMKPSTFDTDDPELNKHVYILRAVLFHDGALVSGQHLYAYIRRDDGSWWKIQEHQATKVDFDSIRTDKTGLFMDGGPYMLLYSREGPRLAPPTPEGESLIDLSESDTALASSQDTVKADEVDTANASSAPGAETVETKEKEDEQML